MTNMLKNFNFLAELSNTPISCYFQLHRMLCLSCIRALILKSDPHVTFSVKIAYLSGLVCYFGSTMAFVKKINAHTFLITFV